MNEPKRILQRVIAVQLLCFVLLVFVVVPFNWVLSGMLFHRGLAVETDIVAKKLYTATSLDAMQTLLASEASRLFCQLELTDSQGRILYTTGVEGTHNDPKPRHLYKYFFYRTKVLNGRNRYILTSFVTLAFIKDVLRHYFLTLCVLVVFFWVGYNLFLFYFLRSLTKPLGDLEMGMQRYQKSMDEPLFEFVMDPVTGPKEVQALYQSFMKLAEHITKVVESIQAEKQEKNVILRFLGDGVLAVDQNERIRYLNPKACDLLDLQEEAIINQPISHLASVHGEKFGSRLLRIIKATLERKVDLMDSVCIETQGRRYIDLVSAYQEIDGGGVVVLQDKTSYYKIVDMGKDFIANASHELRTPITIIKGFAEFLQDAPELSISVVKEIMPKILHNSERMELLVQSLLTLSDIENMTELDIRHGNLLEILERAQEAVRTKYTGVAIEQAYTEAALWILADFDILELAIYNILDNAVKYSPAPATIFINAGSSDSKVYLSIKDYGKGIPEADLPYIFDRFYTVDKTHSRRLGGAGLGLSIVKNIVDKHRGKIEVRSIVGEGTTFTLSFPQEKRELGVTFPEL